MLNIQKVEHIARILGTSPSWLMSVADAADSYYENLVLFDPARPDKTREVVNVKGELRRLQSLLYKNLLKPHHKPSIFGHGGIQGRHIKSNVEAHRNSTFVFTTDVENFYPSIGHHRVYRLFSGLLRCSPDVARICTRLCTYRWCLSLGLITSPILADCLMKQVDTRLGAMSEKHGLIYTRFVDDISLSARFPVESGSFMKIVTEILNEHGFRVNPLKHGGEHNQGRLSDKNYITKLQIKRGRIDVSTELLAALESQIVNASKLANGGDWEGVYYTPGQVFGRIQYVGWINPGRLPGLLRRYNGVNWKKTELEALSRGLVASGKRLVRQNDSA